MAASPGEVGIIFIGALMVDIWLFAYYINRKNTIKGILKYAPD